MRQQGDDDGTGVLVGGVGIARVGTIEVPVPLVGQADREPLAGLGIEQLVIRPVIIGVADGLARLHSEAQLREHRLQQRGPAVRLIAGLALRGGCRGFSDQGGDGVARVSQPRGVPDAALIAQALPQVVIGEEATVVEELLGPLADAERRPELVALRDGVGFGPGEPAQNAQHHSPVGTAKTIDGEPSGDYLDRCTAGLPVTRPQVEEDEVELAVV